MWYGKQIIVLNVKVAFPAFFVYLRPGMTNLFLQTGQNISNNVQQTNNMPITKSKRKKITAQIYCYKIHSINKIFVVVV